VRVNWVTTHSTIAVMHIINCVTGEVHQLVLFIVLYVAVVVSQRLSDSIDSL